MIDSMVIDSIEIRDCTYIRFDAEYWYKYDRNIDTYTRVSDQEWLEDLFQDEKEDL